MKIVKNPDTDYVKTMKKWLKSNSGYCPNAFEKSPDTKCMCREFREMVESGIEGWCGCGLYQSVPENDAEEEQV